MKREFLQNLKVGDSPLPKEVIDAIMDENGKDIEAAKKQFADYDGLKEKLKVAEDSLKAFDGIDPANIKTQLEEANRKIKEAEENAQKQLDERDFNDALRGELDALKFSSAAARRSVEAEIRSAGLKLKNGKILGLSDLIEQMKKDDADAFVNVQNPPARFTTASNNGMNNANNGITAKDIAAIKDPVERQAKIAQNMHLFKKG